MTATAMSRSQNKSRARSSGSGFGSPARAGFGGFSAASTASSLSYLSPPPDYSAISDAHVVVAFKNLLKKDSTTKAKALEELVAFVQAHPHERDGGAEEGILEAWVQIYPRASIDNARRVRELSHTLQLGLMKSARRRMEKRVPHIVGAWLAGTFDRDRGVSRAAADGLSAFLNTDEKTVQFWKKCGPQIVEYAASALKETPATLSDERSTTKDDADAKYHRVIGASLALVLSLLQKLDAAETEKLQESLAAFFATDAVWESATASDSHVRKTAFQLLSFCLDRRGEHLTSELPRLGKIMVSDALKSSQSGSALDYVEALTVLTEKHPEVWGEKKPPFSRLCPLLEKGSQGSTSTSFWRALDQLLAVIPQSSITVEAAANVTKALRAGITNRDEPRSNALDAWTLYLSTVRRLTEMLSPEDARVPFIQENVYPLAEHYLLPSAERSSWALGAHLPIVTRALTLLSRSASADVVKSLEGEWEKLSNRLVSRMTNSLPEVSKDHQQSQLDIADEGTRWFSLVDAIHQETKRLQTAQNTATTTPAIDLAGPPSMELLRSASELLVKRNYKPFGAASLLSSAFERVPYLIQRSGTQLVSSLFPTTETENVGVLLRSPSAPFLLSCLSAIGRMPEYSGVYETAFRTVATSLVSHSDNSETAETVTSFIRQAPIAELMHKLDGLQEYIKMRCVALSRGSASCSWDLFDAAMASNAMSPQTSKDLTREIVRTLGNPGTDVAASLRALEIIARKKPELLSEDEALHLDLVTRLLGVMEVSDTSTSAKAGTLRLLLEKQPVTGQPPIVRIVQENLDDAGPGALEIETLVQQAGLVAEAGSVSNEDLFPNTNIWLSELMQFLQGDINPALSLTSNLGGAYLLVRAQDGNAITSKREAKRDRNGLSIPARMAIYTAQVLSLHPSLFALPQELQVELLFLLYLVAELSSDQIALPRGNGLWAATSAEDAMSSIRHALNKTILELQKHDDEPGHRATLDALVQTMIRNTQTLTPIAVYSARALSDLFQSLVDAKGLSTADEDSIAKLDVLKATPSTVMTAVAVLAGYGEALGSSKLVSNLCNRLISDVSGAKPGSEKTLLSLVLLNSCMAVYEVGELPVAHNRIVFAVRHISTWLGEPEDVDARLAAESCRALHRLLPCIKDVYGPYWEKAIEFCIHLWRRAANDTPHVRLPYLYPSIKLMGALEAMSEPNDDLVDAIKTSAESRSSGLLELLSLPRDGGASSQPEEIVDGILCRAVSKMPLDHIGDLSALYGLVASESSDIQAAAFGLLHRALPAAQQQISVDVLLDKRDAHLPDELLSLLGDAPTLESYYQDAELSPFPRSVRSYLLSWHLVFDAFSTAAVKVRNDYAEDLKTARLVGPLLDFTVDVLGHSAAHALNLEKEGLGPDSIQEWYGSGGQPEPDEKSMHWLLVHLYYQTLRYLPSLARVWYLECRSKQTRVALETWTTRYLSPLVVADALDDVQVWADAAAADDDGDKELLVKVNRTGREVVAGYEVDELQASIAIRLPPSYPLDPVAVVGINRLAVNEKKWQSWLMITQGVITFSNGSIIDGLVAFRRNVVGALKGQTECAICYSIISSDKRMPDKRCSTCRNLFHRTCLYKWFQSSNQNTCPLCRNPIDYLGADTRVRRSGGRDDY